MRQTYFNGHRVNFLIILEIFTYLDAEEKFVFQDNNYTLDYELFTYATSLPNQRIISLCASSSHILCRLVSENRSYGGLVWWARMVWFTVCVLSLSVLGE